MSAIIFLHIFSAQSYLSKDRVCATHQELHGTGGSFIVWEAKRNTIALVWVLNVYCGCIFFCPLGIKGVYGRHFVLFIIATSMLTFRLKEHLWLQLDCLLLEHKSVTSLFNDFKSIKQGGEVNVETHTITFEKAMHPQVICFMAVNGLTIGDVCANRLCDV